MAFLRPGFLIAVLIGSSLTPIGAVQSGSSDEAFTLVVASPTLAKDVQLRYYVIVGNGGGYGGPTAATRKSTAISVAGNKIRFKTPEMSGQPPKTVKLLAYAPGCQFVILTENLSNSSREADFRCQQLPTLQLHGRVDIHDFPEQDLEVEGQYRCRMAVPFRYPKESDVVPLSVGKAAVATDGTFTMEVPDFVVDPSWSQVAHYASLQFVLLDAKAGKHLAYLISLADLSRNQGLVPVASSYPEIVLSVHHPEANRQHLTGN